MDSKYAVTRISFSGNFTLRLFFFLQNEIELRNNFPSMRINGDGGVTSFFVPNLGKYNSCEITRGGGSISLSSMDFFNFLGWFTFFEFIFSWHDFKILFSIKVPISWFNFFFFFCVFFFWFSVFDLNLFLNICIFKYFLAFC